MVEGDWQVVQYSGPSVPLLASLCVASEEVVAAAKAAVAEDRLVMSAAV